VISGFGLSAFFFSTIAHYVFPGNTDGFLALLAIGASSPMILGWLFVRPIPASSEYEVVNTTEDEEETLLSAPAVVHPSSSQTHLLSTEDGESDVVREDYGVQLLRHIDFWVLFLTMALLTGIGLMCAYSVDISAMHI
jgi:hypothetical protein